MPIVGFYHTPEKTSTIKFASKLYQTMSGFFQKYPHAAHSKSSNSEVIKNLKAIQFYILLSRNDLVLNYSCFGNFWNA